MEETYAIEVDHISKRFKIYLDKGHEIKDYVTSSRRRKYENREVLKDVSFKVKKGEAIGLIGHNGCGKSTTLKLLTKIMYPDSGTITMRGRVSSLIELGAGFHPDMSGRENIYINASIFGLTKKEIDRRLDDIIAFSELEEFIDNPVRTYSSGMYMRLAFAVAINVDADILLIDEILAVGDVNFQAKCFNRLREIKAEGTTIVIVSHSMSQIEQICERSIWIHEGLVREEGAPTTVDEHYLDYMGRMHSQAKAAKTGIKGEESKKKNKTDSQEEKTGKTKNAETAGDTGKAGNVKSFGTADHAQDSPGQNTEPETVQRNTRITRVCLCDRDGQEKSRFRCGEPVQLRIAYQADLSELDNPLIGLKFIRNDALVCYGTNTEREQIRNIPFHEKGTLYCNIERLNLAPGEYWIDVAFRNFDMTALDYAEKCCCFQMYSTVNEIGVARLDHTWQFED
ncbi:MAG: ABC transporter ATP-binding protein [Lachnospiraceae bacterium]|nr:ABC transporter ATP-binding protein [Lachnospiraceae bacterium]